MLVDAHAHVDRYHLVREGALDAALAEKDAILRAAQENLVRLFQGDPWLDARLAQLLV